MLSDSISDRTIALLLSNVFIITRLMRHLYNRLEPTKLMCRLICNLPELSIRILIRLLPIFILDMNF